MAGRPPPRRPRGEEKMMEVEKRDEMRGERTRSLGERSCVCLEREIYSEREMREAPSGSSVCVCARVISKKGLPGREKGGGREEEGAPFFFFYLAPLPLFFFSVVSLRSPGAFACAGVSGRVVLVAYASPSPCARMWRREKERERGARCAGRGPACRRPAGGAAQRLARAPRPPSLTSRPRTRPRRHGNSPPPAFLGVSRPSSAGLGGWDAQLTWLPGWAGGPPANKATPISRARPSGPSRMR